MNGLDIYFSLDRSEWTRKAELICHLTIRFRVGYEKCELVVIACVALGLGGTDIFLVIARLKIVCHLVIEILFAFSDVPPDGRSGFPANYRKGKSS